MAKAALETMAELFRSLEVFRVSLWIEPGFICSVEWLIGFGCFGGSVLSDGVENFPVVHVYFPTLVSVSLLNIWMNSYWRNYHVAFHFICKLNLFKFLCTEKTWHKLDRLFKYSGGFLHFDRSKCLRSFHGAFVGSLSAFVVVEDSFN